MKTLIKLSIILLVLQTANLSFAQERVLPQSKSMKWGMIQKSQTNQSTKDLTFFDNFESYDDFALQFGGWTLINVDQHIPWGLGVGWPHEGVSIAATIMNPHQTNPPIDVDVPAYSGNKFMASISAQGEVNDKWMITPKITPGVGQELTFWGKALQKTENCYIYVSTTGTDPSDFTILDDGWVSFYPEETTYNKHYCDLSAYAGQNIYIGFHNESYNSWIMSIDDVKVDDIPATPQPMLNVEALGGSLYVGYSATSQGLRIYNNGAGTLDIIGVTNLSGTPFSATINPEYAPPLQHGQYLEFMVTYAPVEVGYAEADYIISTNYGEVTLHLEGEGLAAPRYSFEDGALPLGWYAYNIDMNFDEWQPVNWPGRAHSGNWSVSVNSNEHAQMNDWLVSAKCIPTVEDHIFGFWALAATNAPVDFEVVISTQTNDNLDFTNLLGSEQGFGSGYYEYFEYDLSAYMGQEIYIALKDVTHPMQFGWYVDDIYIPAMGIPVDVGANEFFGVQTAQLNEPGPFDIVVENHGLETANNVSVKFFGIPETGSEPQLLLEDTFDEGIPGDETMVLHMDVTFPEVGQWIVYYETTMDGDGDTGNNRLASYLHIPVDVVGPPIFIGQLSPTVNDTSTNSIPMACMFYESFSQMIYFSEEVGRPGRIDSISYLTEAFGTKTYADVRIMMAETDKESFEDLLWISYKDLTQVYNGSFTMKQGVNEATIVFDEPFYYTGRNILIQFFKSELNPVHPDYGFQFCLSSPTHKGYRSASSMTNQIDPQNPLPISAGGFITRETVATTFFVNVEDMGNISGAVIYENGNSAEGAIVKYTNVNNPDFFYSIETDQDGNYAFNGVHAGAYYFEVDKTGYYPVIEEVVLNINEQKELNFTLINLPLIQISGRFVSSINPNEALPGTVAIFRYNEISYEVTADANGEFTINNVFGAISIDLEASYTGPIGEFALLKTSLALNETNTDLGDITIFEMAYPAASVLATLVNESEVDITWHAPNSLIEFRHDDGEAVGDVGFAWSEVLMGNVFQGSATVNSIKWFATDALIPANVDVYVLRLAADGKPTYTDPYYIGTMDCVPGWNESAFPEPLNIEDGFFVGVGSVAEYIGVGIDDGVDEPYEFTSGLSYMQFYYKQGDDEWWDFYSEGYLGNIMIRAIGSPGKKEATGPEELGSYNVYRLKSKYKNQKSDLWETVAMGLSNPATTDNNWPPANGTWVYAVEAEYSNGVLSVPAFSNTLVSNAVANADATLSDLTIDGNTISGFNPLVFHYDVILPNGTYILPDVLGTPGYIYASVYQNNALFIPGTTSIVVTAEDGITVNTYTVSFQLAVGIKDASQIVVSVYPNPSSGLFHIEAQNMEVIRVFDIRGRIIESIHLKADQFGLNLNVPAGLYYLQINTSKGSKTQKIVVQ